MTAKNIAFYAPLKAPSNPKPSGDRRLARLLIKSLQKAGYQTELAADLRALDLSGNHAQQIQLRDEALATANQLVEKYKHAQAPDLWFSYHLYHKAPDWIGPVVSARLSIPYVVAEASFAPKQAQGRWKLGHRQVADALAAVDGLIVLNPVDLECVQPLLSARASILALPALVDTEIFKPVSDKLALRSKLASKLGLDSEQPWLITVAMMRSGDKHRSYKFLSRALSSLCDKPWQLIIAGDGEMRAEVESAYHDVSDRVVFVGEQNSSQLAELYNAADIMAWPAVNEAIGMAMLEAQSCAIPVVAGESGAVGTVVQHQHSGFLVDMENGNNGDQKSDCQLSRELRFADAIDTLIEDRQLCLQFGHNAVERVRASHSLDTAAASLRSFIDAL